ncbi:MAG TPA: serine/threonine protein kinase [Phycisphaerales bacterium]|nr:serine/threonine protein kinase [Phycisphaerales bacterium]
MVQIDGFNIIRCIGTGARSTIYLAEDESTGQEVALKRAILEVPSDHRIFEQIETEHKVAAKLDHPYIRKCYRLIKKRKMLKVTEVLLTMEMFEGQSLEELGSLSLGDLLLVFRMVATALNAMHQRGYVHCDIKPNNILISKQEAIKIIDLGQSCKIGTVKARIQGTPDYIAPEQVQRKHLSHRTDIFNLGATMYWALTGRNVPTQIPKKSEIAQRKTEKEVFKSPHEIYRKIPETLSDVVMECIQEDPSRRPGSMTVLTTKFDFLIREIFGSKYKNNATSNH